MDIKREMSFFKVSIDKKYKDLLLRILADIEDVHIKVRETIDKSEKEKGLTNKSIEYLRLNLNDLLAKLGIYENDFLSLNVRKDMKMGFRFTEVNDLINNLSEEINYYANRINELEKFIARTTLELENIEVIGETYDFLSETGISQKSSSQLKYFNFNVYTTFSKNLSYIKELSESPEIPNVIEHKPISRERIAFFLVSPKDKQKDIMRRISVIHAEEVPILQKYLTSTGVNFERINKERVFIKSTLKKYQLEFQRIRDENLLKFAAINEAVYNLEEFNWVENQFRELSLTHIGLNFFAPLEKKDQIKSNLMNNFHDNIKLDVVDINKRGKLEKDQETLREETPTLMRHNRIVRPFETLTKMYGVPSYSEIDPTTFLFFTFPLLFGIMFGDIGHGLVLIIAGIIGSRIMKKSGPNAYNFTWILFWCGIWAIVGGFLYGEFFGTEEIFGIHLQPIPIPIPGVGFITLYDPLNNVMTIFILTLFIGVIHINLGWILQIINFWRSSKKYKALTETLMKLLFLDGGVYIIFTQGFDFNKWLSGSFPPVLFALIPGLMLLLFKPLGKVFRVSYMKKESYGALLGEGSMEAFETVLSLPSNVLSYVRLLALLLAHISLMVAIRAMVGIIPGQDIWFVQIIIVIALIFGNLVVILLEGVIVFLNTIRLHFYEFFFKFYGGKGKEFIPFILRSDYSTLTIDVGIERDLISSEIDKEIETEMIRDEISKARETIDKKFSY